MTTLKYGAFDYIREWHGNPNFRQRLQARIDRRLIPSGDCILWVGKTTDGGYGEISVCGQGMQMSRRVHRLVYELAVGPVPDGMVLDHLCHSRDQMCLGGNTCPHRRCVNPEHLEPVSQQENVARGRLATSPRSASPHKQIKTHCKRGHEFTDDNTYRPPSRPNARWCLICTKARDAARWKRQS